MSDKLTELTVLTSLQDSDLLYVVTDVATTPVSRAVEVDVLDARYAPIAGSLTRIGNGTVQYQVPVTGATPFTPVWSGFLLAGTSGGKTVFAVTDTKTLTLTSAGDYNLTVPATGTAALLGTANVFTQRQTITATADAALSDEYITATANRDFSATTDWTGTNWLRPLLAVAQANDVTVDAAGKTFTRTAGSFITDGFKVGMSVTWSGFVKAGTVNNNTFVITTLTNLVMTCSAATLSDEVPADYTACSATSAVFSHAVAGANAATLANDKLTAAPANGSIFQVTITAQTVVANTLTVSIGGVAMASVIGKVTGALTAYVFNIEATGAGVLTVTPGATWLGWIDDISVKLVTSAASLLDGKMLAGTTVLETRVPNSTSMGMGLNTLKGSVQTNCIAFGHNALQSNTGAYSNAFGYGALYQNTGEYSNAFGYVALYQNTARTATPLGTARSTRTRRVQQRLWAQHAPVQHRRIQQRLWVRRALPEHRRVQQRLWAQRAPPEHRRVQQRLWAQRAPVQHRRIQQRLWVRRALPEHRRIQQRLWVRRALPEHRRIQQRLWVRRAPVQHRRIQQRLWGRARSTIIRPGSAMQPLGTIRAAVTPTTIIPSSSATTPVQQSAR